MKYFQKMRVILATGMVLSLLASLCVPVSAFDAARPTSNVIAAGFDHAGLVDENGTLWMWGGNDFGQLGDGGITSANTPVKIMEDVISVSSSGYGQGNMPRTVTTAAIKSDGSLWTWGVADNATGILGNANGGNSSIEIDTISEPARIPIQTVPTKVLDDVASVSLGGWCALAIKKDGSLWAWGNMGYDDDSFDSIVPVKVMDGVVSACAGPQCAAAIKTDGSLWMWGYDLMADDEFNNEHWELYKTPTKVMDDVSEVSIGCTTSSGAFAYVAAVKTDGSLWMWGTDEARLGLPGDEWGTNSTPVKMMDDVTHVSTGCGHIAVLKTDSSLWTWGENYYGQLGNGTEESSTKPVKVLEDVVSVSAGIGFTLATKKDGSVWSWGSNSSGELGNGGQGNAEDNYGIYQTIPLQIPGLKVKTNGSGPAEPSEGVTVSDVRIQNGRLMFTVSPPAGTDGVLLAAGWRDGGQFSGAALTSGGNVSLAGKSASVYLLEKETLIPLAEAVSVTG